MTRSIKRIAIIGPESTGKTTLAQDLASRLSTKWVPEYAREYLDNLDRAYNKSDLVEIAKGQLQIEELKEAQANSFLICDTNLIVIKVWSEVKYGVLDQWIDQKLSERDYDLYFLTGIEIPWEYDPQRENPENRIELFRKYEQYLIENDLPFFVLEGTKKDRIEKALGIINNL